MEMIIPDFDKMNGIKLLHDTYANIKKYGILLATLMGSFDQHSSQKKYPPYKIVKEEI